MKNVSILGHFFYYKKGLTIVRPMFIFLLIGYTAYNAGLAEISN